MLTQLSPIGTRLFPLLNLLFVGALLVAEVVVMTSVFVDAPPWFVARLVIPMTTAVSAIGLIVFSVQAWRASYWSVIGRVHYTLVTLAALAFIWFTNYWNLLSFRL